MKVGTLIMLFLVVMLCLTAVLSGMVVSLKHRVEAMEAHYEEIDHTNKQFDNVFQKYMQAELDILEKLNKGEYDGEYSQVNCG